MKIHDIITEGINDPDIFKAVFTLGGPGSGKTTISRKLLAHSGLRPVDVDAFYKLLSDKDAISGGYTKELYKQAHVKSRKRLDLLLAGRLGVIIDGTGRNIERIKVIKDRLEALGYDTLALFVNVDLATALARNETRVRKVNPEQVKQMHADVRNNLGDIQRMFGNQLMIVDNDNTDVLDLGYYSKEIDKFLSTPPRRPQARAWIADHR